MKRFQKAAARAALALALGLLAILFVAAAVQLERRATGFIGGLAMAVVQRPARFAAAALALVVLGWMIVAAICAVESLRGRARSRP